LHDGKAVLFLENTALEAFLELLDGLVNNLDGQVVKVCCAFFRGLSWA
jgi:hypothetical protein